MMTAITGELSSTRVPRFRDRREAGARLAQALGPYRGQNPLVLGIPRGGVPVAAEVAHALDADLDIIVARKVGAPGNPELALGAVTGDGGRVLNAALIAQLAVAPSYLEEQIAAQLAEVRRREDALRGGLPRYIAAGRCTIIVDDGLATGATMGAAVAAVRACRPLRVVVAVPVGSREACAALRTEVDELICLYAPEPFVAVGCYYDDFLPTDDSEVRHLLRSRASARRANRPVRPVGERGER
jgi:predicted phosphoribosyltransferase